MMGWECWGSLHPVLACLALLGCTFLPAHILLLGARGDLYVAPAPPWASVRLLVVPQGWPAEYQASSTPSSAGAGTCRGTDDHLPA